jgi:hypothetical protein
MMRTTVRKAVFWVLLLTFLLPGPASGQAGSSLVPAEAPAALIERMQKRLRAGDIASYLEAFSPEIRPSEQARLSVFFDDLKMTGVSLRTAGVQTAADGPTRVFVQAFFENDYSAVIESWTLALDRPVYEDPHTCTFTHFRYSG